MASVKGVVPDIKAVWQGSGAITDGTAPVYAIVPMPTGVGGAVTGGIVPATKVGTARIVTDTTAHTNVTPTVPTCSGDGGPALAVAATAVREDRALKNSRRAEKRLTEVVFSALSPAKSRSMAAPPARAAVVLSTRRPLEEGFQGS